MEKNRYLFGLYEATAGTTPLPSKPPTENAPPFPTLNRVDGIIDMFARGITNPLVDDRLTRVVDVYVSKSIGRKRPIREIPIKDIASQAKVPISFVTSLEGLQIFNRKGDKLQFPYTASVLRKITTYHRAGYYS